MDGAGVSRAARRFAAVLAAAVPLGGACAQQCYFESILSQPPVAFSTANPVRVVYDTVRGRILLVDSPVAPALTRLYAWSGSAWILLDSNGPVGRSAPAVAFDGIRDRLVLFGGLSSAYHSDVWEWNGTVWTTTIPAAGPSGRFLHAMAWDAFRSRIVMFGGFGSPGSVYLDDTWTWDGATWALQLPGNPRPLARIDHAMAFDSARGRVMMFSGYRPDSGNLRDLWEWNGGSWVQRPTSPFQSFESGLCFDPGRSRLTAIEGLLGDVWEFDGVTGQWARIIDFPTSISGARTLLFDSMIGRPVLSSGSGLRVWHAEGTHFAPAMAQQPFFGGAFCPGSGTAISAEAAGGAPFTYRWHRNGQPLVNGWNTSGADSQTMFINPVTLADAGSYTVVVTNPCGSVTSNVATLTVPTSGCSPAPCYANCDASLVPPLLTANDFACFLDAFAAGHPYANCDGSTAPPTLTGNDFQCFLDRFVAGCP